MDAISLGTQAAFSKRKNPYTSLTVERSSYSIGEYLLLEMATTIYASALLDVNPFDQPAVEDYKEEARKRLR